MLLYWNGVTTEAGASWTPRVMHRKPPTAPTPIRTMPSHWPGVGQTQPSAVASTNSASAALWLATSTMLGTRRRRRVATIEAE